MPRAGFSVMNNCAFITQISRGKGSDVEMSFNAKQTVIICSSLGHQLRVRLQVQPTEQPDIN